MTEMRLQPISGTLGSEVRGLSLGSLSDEELAEVQTLLYERRSLFFPEQHLSVSELRAFAERLGEVEGQPYLPLANQAVPDVTSLKPEPSGSYLAEMWHCDQPFIERPTKFTIYQAIVVPPVGGDTMWADQVRAFEALSPKLQEMLCQLHGVQRARRPGLEAVHPAVRLIPETKELSLFVNDHTVRFEELTDEESRPIIEYLMQHATQMRFTCRYRAAAGSVVIWDNRTTQHIALNDFSGPREIHRVTVRGEVPLGVGALSESP